MRKVLLSAIFSVLMLGAALGQTLESCAEDACRGVFSVGPYRMQFFATQDESGDTRFFREIPSFGPTHLNVAFADAVNASDAADLRVDLTLFWGKNELKPPLLLETLHLRGTEPVAFDYDFTEDGKYIAVVEIARPGEEKHRGQFIFFVIQTAESGIPVALFIGAATGIFIFLIWRTRQPAATPPARRR